MHWLRLAEAVGMVLGTLVLIVLAIEFEIVGVVITGLLFLAFLGCLVMVAYSLLGG
jgi:hypothetical protein